MYTTVSDLVHNKVQAIWYIILMRFLRSKFYNNNNNTSKLYTNEEQNRS